VRSLDLLFVVQRYGEEVPGGAEAACREVAVRLAARGHQVQVATTCARSYVTWEDHYPAGETVMDGVRVHRFCVDSVRDHVRFGALSARVLFGKRPVPYHLQADWVEQQGPQARRLLGFLAEHSGEFDVVVFFTYLYWTTWAGIPVASRTTPTVIQTTAHDERPFHLPVFDAPMRAADGFLCLTPEEADLVAGKVGRHRPIGTTGMGVDLEVRGTPDRFRSRFGLGDRPYLLYLGRVDPHKGASELLAHFATYKDRNGGDLALVVMGEEVTEVPQHADIVTTGFVDEATKHDALAGMLALALPSYYESFSMVLCEAWAQRRPGLVQGRCQVLVGQAHRSGGAVPYTGYGQFEVALDELLRQPGLADQLGRQGRAFVEEHYSWANVLSLYESFLWQRTLLPGPGRR
jgi:glycosyltransferase involved in cell wall biosynthesis